MTRPIFTIGDLPLYPDKAIEHKHRQVSILYDITNHSCKIIINGDGFNKKIPVQGGVSVEQLSVLVNAIVGILEETNEGLAREVIQALSRFLIGRPRPEVCSDQGLKYVRHG